MTYKDGWGPDLTEPNNNEVICPKCCHQFRAIPVNVQHELTAANERIRELEADFASTCEKLATENDASLKLIAQLTAEREVSDNLEKALTGILGWIDDWCETSDGDFQTLELAADAALAEVAHIRSQEVAAS